MSGLSRLVAARRPEEVVLAAPARDVAVTAAMPALTAVVVAAVADHGILARIQRVDDGWLRLMVSGRSAPVTAIAKFFNLHGLVYVTLPVRIAIAGFLALRRRWWHMAAFVAVTEQIVQVNEAICEARPAPPAAAGDGDDGAPPAGGEKDDMHPSGPVAG